MGCAPSRPNSSIRVEERKNIESRLENSVRSYNRWTINDANVSKDIFDIADNEVFEADKSTDSFLQGSMKSHHSQLSTNSSSSRDSGVYELDDEYSHIITEYSAPEKVREVDNEFVPKDDLELIIEGKACPRKLSSRDRERLEQQAILERLREEGLVVRPPAKAGGGLKFEVVSAQEPANGCSFLRRLPPLEIQKKQKKKALTIEEIQKKLQEAEERRKKQHEEKLQKLAAKDVHEFQAVSEHQIEMKREEIENNLQAKLKSREQRLNEVQEKLKAREEHAKKVRKRKELISNGFNYILPNQPE